MPWLERPSEARAGTSRSPSVSSSRASRVRGHGTLPLPRSLLVRCRPRMVARGTRRLLRSGTARSSASIFAARSNYLIRSASWNGDVLVASGHDAAVDVPHRAGHPAGLRGKQEGDGGCDVARRANPAGRMECIAAMQGLLDLVLGNATLVEGRGGGCARDGLA